MLPVLDSRLRDAVFYEQPINSILNPPESTGMGYWSANPYVGCEFGCSYCYARFAHRYVVERAGRAGIVAATAFAPFQGQRASKAFEHRIFVKREQSIREALERDLGRLHRRQSEGETAEIVLGTATDPYQPAERKFRLTRTILARLANERGLCISIISKSPLVCRDIDVLKKLQRHNQLAIHVSLITLDPRLVRLLEPRSPLPHARLRGLSKLSGAGLDAGLIVAPVLPGINDSIAALTALLEQAKQAGARFAHPAPLRLYRSIREEFLGLIEAHFPELASRYRHAYQGRGAAPREYTQALSKRFGIIAARCQLRVDHSAMRFRSGNEPVDSGRQLPLW